MTDERNSSTPEPPLESWKAIAAHLSRDVRTVKRWEKNEGLPVRRYLHQARSSVYVFASELDAWRAARAPRPMEDAPAPIGGQVLPRFAFAEDRQMNWATAQLSRDGTSLVYVRSASGGATVRVVDLTRKQTVREIALQPGEVYNVVTWSPDGRAIYGLLGSRVLRVPLPSGEPQEVIQGRFRSLAVSPDGRTLALTGNAPTIEGGAGSERYELYVASASGGELKRVRVPDGHNPWRVRWSPDGKLGYISLQAKSQFLRLSDFLPRRE